LRYLDFKLKKYKGTRPRSKFYILKLLFIISFVRYFSGENYILSFKLKFVIIFVRFSFPLFTDKTTTVNRPTLLTNITGNITNTSLVRSKNPVAFLEWRIKQVPDRIYQKFRTKTNNWTKNCSYSRTTVRLHGLSNKWVEYGSSRIPRIRRKGHVVTSAYTKRPNEDNIQISTKNAD